MDNAILGVTLGLVLIYSVLALLVTKLVESFNGAATRGRTSVLHRLVYEAVGQDEELRAKLYKNPLIYALSPNKDPARPDRLFGLRPTGPSAIPPALFARALLMEINGGKHPSEDFGTPVQFLEAANKTATNGSRPSESDKRQRLLQGLSGLMAGRQNDWTAFEAAIAGWFSDIGDRSEGWFKRRADVWTWAIAILVSLGLNVDTIHIAQMLGNDDQLRANMTSIAELVVREREGNVPSAAPPESKFIRNPEARATARLTDAIIRLREAYDGDNVIATFAENLLSTSTYCSVVKEISPAGDNKSTSNHQDGNRFGKFVSNAITWQQVLPSLHPLITRAAHGLPIISQDAQEKLNSNTPSGTIQPRAGPITAKKSSTSVETGQASLRTATVNSQGPHLPPAHLSASPLADTAVTSQSEVQATSIKGGSTGEKTLQDVHLCMSHINAWVRAAGTASKKPDVRRLMEDAAVALEDSTSALLDLLKQSQLTASLRTVFLRSPQNFTDCVRDASSTRYALDACLRRESSVFDRLPLFHSKANWRQQFCTVKSVREGEKAPDGHVLCEADSVPGNKGLGIPGMALVFSSLSPFSWLTGVLISSAFIALGAPFWFGLMSRLVRIRAAGDVRDATDNRLRRVGPQPVPPPTYSLGYGDQTLPPARTVTPGSPSSSTVGAVEMSSNRFEDQLTAREVIALQQALDVPASGKLDATTRIAIRKRSSELGLGSEDTLTLSIYTALVGRPPRNANTTIEITGITRPRRRKPHPLTPSLTENLIAMLDFPDRILNPKDQREFSDEVRALSVLYRYKKDTTTPLRMRAVCKLASDQPAQLDELNEQLMNDILSWRDSRGVLPRETARWMDWALGELGQVENNASTREASNPRICEYLDSGSLKLGSQGDKTPWCGAFITWVLERYNKELSAQGNSSLQASIAASPAEARSWIGWQRPSGSKVRASDIQPGDVVVVKTDANKYHVAFCLEKDAVSVWLIGGNQSEGGRVCISRWLQSHVQ